MTERWVCLDLFAGLGGFSAAFGACDRWEVFTVDIETRFDPDLQTDVMDVRPSDLIGLVGGLESINALVVLASPPCTQFSLAASRLERIVDGAPQTPNARAAVSLVYHTIGLIEALAPDYWFLENPQGHLRAFLGEPAGRVTYCQYGTDYMKPTDLWGEHPPMRYRACSYGGECHTYNTDQIDDPAKRALVPYDLSEAIRDAVEAAIQTPTLTQSTLTEAADD